MADTSISVIDNSLDEYREIPDFYTPEQFEKLLKRVAKLSRYPKRDRLLLLLAYGHGMRCSEVVKLKRGDIEGGVITFRRSKGCNRHKGGKGSPGLIHRQRLSGRELRAFGEYMATRKDANPWLFLAERNGTHITRQNAHRIVSRAAKQLGFEITKFHALRHGCGYKLVNEGVPQRHIQTWLGHRSPSSTLIYTVVDERRLEHITALF